MLICKGFMHELNVKEHNIHQLQLSDVKNQGGDVVFPNARVKVTPEQVMFSS